MKLLVLILVFYTAPVASLLAQTPTIPAQWAHLEALPQQTRIHVRADKLSRSCVLDSIDDTALKCSKGRIGHTAHYVFPREQVISVTLTHYTRSTFLGIGLGLGTGLAIGGGVGHAVDPKNGQLLSGLGGAIITAASGIVGAIAGGTILGPADFTRGPTIYRRM
jgi:hypothetical protein